MKRRHWLLWGGIFLLLIVNTAFAQSVPIANGLNYLSSSQNPDGSWGGVNYTKALLLVKD